MFNKAVERATVHRREMFKEKIETVRKRTAQLSAQEMIKLVKSGTDNPPKAEPTSVKVVEEEIEETVETQEHGGASATDSESSSSESDSSWR